MIINIVFWEKGLHTKCIPNAQNADQKWNAYLEDSYNGNQEAGKINSTLQVKYRFRKAPAL